MTKRFGVRRGGRAAENLVDTIACALFLPYKGHHELSVAIQALPRDLYFLVLIMFIVSLLTV